jgi:hypothetical protein
MFEFWIERWLLSFWEAIFLIKAHPDFFGPMKSAGVDLHALKTILLSKFLDALYPYVSFVTPSFIPDESAC